MSIIEVSNLSKSYKIALKDPGLKGTFKSLFWPQTAFVHAVQDLHFAIETGEIVAYLGPNGTGKSTTIKLLTGILTPSAGHIQVLGIEPYEKRIENARNIGVVFGQRSQLRWDLPVIESFELHRRLYGLSSALYQHQMALFESTLALGSLLRKNARSLSLGQKMLCNIALSLLHKPPIVYLDEPTIGLDIVVKESIRDFFVHMNREHGVTVFLTTQYLEEADALAERVAIIAEGRIVEEGAPAALKRDVGADVIVVDLAAEDISAAADAAVALPQTAVASRNHK